MQAIRISLAPPDYDQRGPGFDRVRNGRIDIGSFEVQNPRPHLLQRQDCTHWPASASSYRATPPVALSMRKKLTVEFAFLNLCVSISLRRLLFWARSGNVGERKAANASSYAHARFGHANGTLLRQTQTTVTQRISIPRLMINLSAGVACLRPST